ncbi:MAG TPA: hypothetical protein VN086_00860 [Candidatus Paceibacterota bacterium]|nr:hypothetical protein [Candidatus Paceibacterota bacterium]
MKMRRVTVLVLLGMLVGVISYWYFVARPAYPSASDVCVGMITSSIEAARSNPAVTVPDFSLHSIRHVRCEAVPGMTHFVIAGTDSSGKEFHIYETTGGKAASGGDSVFDYCYTQNGTVVSQVRITGRDGNRSDSACTYGASLLGDPTHSYIFGI